MYIISIIIAAIGAILFLTLALSYGFDMCAFSNLILVLPCVFATIHRHKQKKQEEEERRTAEREAAEQKRLAEEKERKLAEEGAERLRRQSEELKRKMDGSKKRFNEIKQQICGRMFDVLESNNVSIDQHSIFIFAGHISEDVCNDLWIKLWSKNILDNLKDKYKSALDELINEYKTKVEEYNAAPNIIAEYESQNHEFLEKKKKLKQDIYQRTIDSARNSGPMNLNVTFNNSANAQAELIILKIDRFLNENNKIIEEKKELLRNTDPNTFSEKYNRKLAETKAYYENKLDSIENAFGLLRNEFKEVEGLYLDEAMSHLKYAYRDWIFSKTSNYDEVFSIAEGRYIYIGNTYPKNNGNNSKPLYTWDGNRMYNGDGSEKNVLYTINGRYVYKGEDTEGTAVYTLV